MIKPGDKFIIEVSEEVRPGIYEIKDLPGHIFTKNQLMKIEKKEEAVLEGYRKAIMKKFTEVR